MDDAQYLGDGLYARFDGYYIRLAANHPANETVAIEADVMLRLVEFAQQIGMIATKEHTT
jgi:hypothetical protein